MANQVRDNPERQRFELEADGHVAFSNYRRTGNVLTILHTEVPKALEGRGIGSSLTKGVLDIAAARASRSRQSARSPKATSNGTRNTPTCGRNRRRPPFFRRRKRDFPEHT